MFRYIELHLFFYKIISILPNLGTQPNNMLHYSKHQAFIISSSALEKIINMLFHQYHLFLSIVITVILTRSGMSLREADSQSN